MKSFALTSYVQLRWRAFLRSPMLSTQIIGLIFGGFLILYFSAIAVAIGLLAGELIREELGEAVNVYEIVDGYLLYIFATDLMMRVVLQSSPRVDLRPLFILPFSKKDLLRKQNLRPFFERLHLIWFLVFTSFVLMNPGEGRLFWWLGAMCIPWMNAYLISLWKSWNTQRPLIAYAVLLPALSPAIVSALDLIPANEYFGDFHKAIQVMHWPLLIYVVIIAVLVFSHRMMLTSLAYSNPKGSSSGTGGHIALLDRYGTTGFMINIRLKQIWRNKRIKRIMIISPLFLLYGLGIFGANEAFANAFPIVVWCIFLTGIGAIQLGQWAFPMDGKEFAFWMTIGNTENYVRSKALFLRIWVVLFSVLSSFYGFFGWDVLIQILSAAVYNYGVTIPLLLVLSTFIRSRLEVNQGGAFNMQGADTITFLSIIPILAFPWIISVLPFGLWIMAGLGVAGTIFQDPITGAVARLVMRRKHIMMAQYAKKD